MAAYFDDDELSMSLSSPPHRDELMQNGPQHPAPPQQRSSRKPMRDGKTEQRIGQYQVKSTLGEGSFGKVKLAVHRISGQQVALKIISRKKLVSRDMAGRVEREIQYLQLLRHPHIIKLYTVITTPSEIIMVLEYAGGELFDYIVKHGKLPENKARRFFQQVVCAVEYCHRHKIVHRDLKPENLLLDKDLNVKIADFGLSNIITDGNFLKTSCGSPNYAAPEVISGKLYAGPEVDVWSCGIILYVLLVGRLPFDDDYIPSLFRKINSGTYYTPSYLTSQARDLIQKMLRVNPVQRITIQEIRQDPWFNEDLEDYLKLPVEEFMDAWIDPNKAIDPRNIAPGKPAKLQEQIHQKVIGKLGKKMGYAKDDVQEALTKDEPNAIKDAYLIVRENQIMQENLNAANAQPFLATSPPAFDMKDMMSPRIIASPLVLTEESKLPFPDNKPLTSQPEAMDSPTSNQEQEPEDSYKSKISILPSSIPYYHSQFLKERKKTREEQMNSSQAGDGTEGERISKLTLDPHAAEQTPEEQAETIRRLKPHSRSTTQLQYITSKPQDKSAEGAKPEVKKTRTRWQFGIRSRNMPHDAMHCVYKALLSQGAEWEIASASEELDRHPRSYPVHVSGATQVNESIHTRSNSPEDGKAANRYQQQQQQQSTGDSYHHDFDYDARSGTNSNNPPSTIPSQADVAAESETDDEDVETHIAPPNYAPKDPWCIRVRWRKDGMLKPRKPAPANTSASTAALYSPTTSSTHNSLQDLHSAHSGSSSAANLFPAGMSPVTSAGIGSAAGSMGSFAAHSSAAAIAAAGVPVDGQSPHSHHRSSPHNHSGDPAPKAEPEQGTTGTTAAAPAAAEDEADGGSGGRVSAYVYMDVQLYTLEAPSAEKQQGTYLVDFKCAGYENLVEKVVGETGRVLVGSGVRVGDKEVTSPQPFLDMTNKLVIALASGG